MPLHEIAFWAAVFFIAGVFAASISVNGTIFMVATFFIAALAGTWAVIASKIRTLWFVGLLLLALPGFFYYHWDDWRLHAFRVPLDEKTAFQGIIVSNPKQLGAYQEVVAELQSPYSGRILMRLPSHPEFAYGNLLKFEGKITMPKPFSYAQYLAKERIVGVSYFPDGELLAENRGSQIRFLLFRFKNSVISQFQRLLPQENAALLSGLTLGEQGEFADDFKDAMRKSGTLHLVALSGYNISIIAWTIAQTLGRLLKRRTAFALTVLFIVGFVIMTGAEASAVRAGIMGILMLVAERSGRIYSFRNALALTALAMILANPKILVFDAGFQLSFAALVGIVYLKPAITRVLVKNTEAGLMNWRENIITTASAQLTVVPILLGNFGGFSFISLLSNALILETVPLVMFLGFLLGALSFINYYLALILGWFTNIFLEYQRFVINLSARLSGPFMIDHAVSFGILLVYCACLITFVIYAEQRFKNTG
ncbi:MAG: ComEC/Rec2 family competence protein [Parcubacteria group bacterium]|nr:ComEC/Rec2 family competence protein [Parcubacteria group bacterium]